MQNQSAPNKIDLRTALAAQPEGKLNLFHQKHVEIPQKSIYFLCCNIFQNNLVFISPILIVSK